ncbi:MAG: beta-galactosidase [Armatimonadota bacterium]|nr:beta-galactosidase [Armatimonadota bacterium]MCX7777513.1 beta-galactosidase [Armatimonadota bacterium]MDW8025989.1 beta-galactosidase [Armatimonadota bacterium]
MAIKGKLLRFQILFSLSLMISELFPAERLPGDYMHEIYLGYETPHVKWAKPYSQGKIKAFFLTPFVGAAREVAELNQRMDLEVHGETTIESTMLGRADGCFPDIQDTRPEEKEQRLRKKLQQRYDVFVIGNFSFEALSTELKHRILEQVHEGAGLVLVYFHDIPKEALKNPTNDERAEITNGIPFYGLPFFMTTFARNFKLESAEEIRNKVVRTFNFGEGRIALVDYSISYNIRPCNGGPGLTPYEPFTFETPTYYEYYHCLIIRTILWAARRLPKIRFISLPKDGMEIEYSRLPKQIFEVKLWSEIPENIDVQISITVRDRWGEIEHRSFRNLSAKFGENSALFFMPRLKAGGHFVDLLLTSKRGRENFASFFINVKSPVEISQIKLGKRSFERDEAVRGEVIFNRPVNGSGVYRLKLELIDNYGRIFAIKEYPIQKGAASVHFQLPLNGALSLVARARAKILAHNNIVHQSEEVFFIPKRELKEYPALIWGRIFGIIGHFARKILRELGFCAVLDGTDAQNASQLAMDDLMLVPYCIRIDERLTDPTFLQQAIKRVTQVAEEVKDFGPLVYSLGDENYIPAELGFKPEHKSDFLDFLRKKYKTLEALNEAWGSNFTSFEEAEPISLSEAKKKRRYVQFHDTESFREAIYAQAHHLLADAIKKVDKRAKVGAEGSEPGDLELTIAKLEFWGPYRSLQYNTLLRSLAPRQLLRGNWFGGYRSQRHNPIILPNFLWETVLDGNTLIQYFAINTAEGIFNTDLSLAYWAKWFIEDFREIVDGIGQLISVSDYDYDGVALHYSQSCVHASQLESTITDYSSANDGFLWLLNDLGVQHFYLPRSEIERGRLKTGDIKVLILPYSQAISRKEAEEFRKFVEKGGLLIADLRPGVMDENCKPLGKGLLDELFGIRRVENAEGKIKPSWAKISGKFKLNLREIVLKEINLTDVIADPGIKIVNGNALGNADGTPVVIVNRSGKGLTVLLNFSISHYTKSRQYESARAFQDLIWAFLSAAGVSTQVQVVDEFGNRVQRCRIVRFKRGKAKIIGVLLQPYGQREKPIKAKLLLRRRSFVYDIRKPELSPRGAVLSLPVQLTPGRANLYSLIPYPVERIKLSVTTKSTLGRPLPIEVLIVAPNEHQPQGHLIRIKVLGPDGKERRHYARTVYGNGALFKTSLPIAFNDQLGKWQILAKDVLTGRKASATFRLQR